MREMRVVPWRCQPCGMGLVFSCRWGLLFTGRHGHEGGFCHGQWATLAVWAGHTEVPGRSAAGAEASAPELLIDALSFGLFLGCQDVHGGRAEVGQVAGDVGGR